MRYSFPSMILAIVLVIPSCFGEVDSDCHRWCKSLENCHLLPSTLGSSISKSRGALEDCESRCTISDETIRSELGGCFPAEVEINPKEGEWCGACRALAGCVEARRGAAARGQAELSLQWCPVSDPLQAEALVSCNEEASDCISSGSALVTLCDPFEAVIDDGVSVPFDADGATIQLEGSDVIVAATGTCTQVIGETLPTVSVPIDHYRTSLILSSTATEGLSCVKVYGIGFVAKGDEDVQVTIPSRQSGAKTESIHVVECEQSLCHDGLDNDRDGASDCFDAECRSQCEIGPACFDGLDNDADLLIDCSDPDCLVGSQNCGPEGDSTITDSGSDSG